MPSHPADARLKAAPGFEPGRLVPPAGPNGVAVRFSGEMRAPAYRTAVAARMDFIRGTVFARRGEWCAYGGWWYYHDPAVYGLVYVCDGSECFWVYCDGPYVRWWHPRHHRWLCWHDDAWLYWDASYGWEVWDEDADVFYVVHDHDVERAPDPGAASAAVPEQVYYSDDGTLAVYVLGAGRSAFLYTYPRLDYVNKLGDGVQAVQFAANAGSPGALLIVVQYSDRSVGIFDMSGRMISATAAPAQ